MQNQDAAPATKGDLNALEARLRTATSGDLHALEARLSTATKADLNALEARLKNGLEASEARTRKDIQDLNRSFAVAMTTAEARTEQRFETQRTEAQQAHSDLVRLIEGSMAQTAKVDRHQIITDYRVDELEKRVKNLEAPH